MADCSNKCRKAPIPEECIRYCLHNILAEATKEEKQLILGLSSTLTDSIYNAFNNKYEPIKNFEDLESSLGIIQSSELLEKFRSLNQYQLDYFNANKSARNDIINSIKRLGLDDNLNSEALY